MLKKLRKIIAYFLYPELHKIDDSFKDKINQRVADILLKMDPFEPLLKKYHGIFSDSFDRPEDKLDEQSKIRLSMWAYQQKHDIQGNFFSDWILNSAGNDLIKLTNPSIERIGYHRSLIANEILRKREIGRLSLTYEELIKKKDDEFDSSVGVE